MEKFFKFEERHTNLSTEIRAGIVTFMTMAYILAVNPSILSAAGMEAGAVFSATVVGTVIACVIMGLYANMPFGLSAGMGLNAYFTYTVVLSMGYTWQEALGAIFIEGIIFILLTLTNVREAIFNAIPLSQKHALTVGIGLFLCFIGLQSAHVVVDSPTLIGAFSFSKSIADNTFSYAGIPALFALIGILLTGGLVAKKVPGALLIGILAVWVMGILAELFGVYVPNVEAGFFSIIPQSFVAMPASMGSTFFSLDLSNIFSFKFLTILLAFLIVDLFDTLGTVIGVSSRMDMLDEKGRLPGIKKVLLADAVGTTCGAVCGTTTITTFVESSSGVEEGGRTGFTAIVVAALFLLALFLSPFFLAIPAFATAPALVIVGFMMMQNIRKIDWNDTLEALPAYMAIIALVFFYSISEGIACGIISYTFLNFACGRRDKITPVMYILTVVFILHYFVI